MTSFISGVKDMDNDEIEIIPSLQDSKNPKDSKSKTYDLCSKCFSGLESYISKQIKSYSDFFS